MKRSLGQYGAFTLVEMTMALAVMMIIGLAAATVTVALSKAYTQNEQMRQSVQESRTALTRMSSALRSAKLVLSASSTSVTFWLSDANGDGLMNLSELCTWTYDASQSKLMQVRVVPPQALDGVVDINNAVNSSATALTAGNAYARWETLSDQVLAFRVTTSPGPPYATLVGLEMVTGEGDQTVRLETAISLRVDSVESLKINQSGQYSLDLLPIVAGL